MRFGIFCLIMFYFRAVPFIFFCISTIFNAANASINSEEDFRWNLVKLSVQVGLSGVIYKNSNDWYGTQKHAKNIMEEIPHMIADCALKRGVFANVKDGIVRFENSNVSSYTNANKNAYLLYNYVYNQMYAGNSSVVNVGAMFSDNGKYDLSKAISDIKTYVKDLKLQGFDKYKDIKTIPHIKIEKRYTEGEAQFSIDQDIYTDPNYKRFQYATKRKVKVAYLKDKKIVLGYENSFANAGISYFMISDDYLNTSEVLEFAPTTKNSPIDEQEKVTITYVPSNMDKNNNDYLDFEDDNTRAREAENNGQIVPIIAPGSSITLYKVKIKKRDKNIKYPRIKLIIKNTFNNPNNMRITDKTFNEFSDTSKPNFDIYDIDLVFQGGVKFPTETSGMFRNVKSIKSIDFSGADMSATTDISHMFYNCPVKQIVLNIPTIKRCEVAISHCPNLKRVDFRGSHYDNNDGISQFIVFNPELEDVRAPKIEFPSRKYDMFQAFAYNPKLRLEKIENFDLDKLGKNILNKDTILVNEAPIPETRQDTPDVVIDAYKDRASNMYFDIAWNIAGKVAKLHKVSLKDTNFQNTKIKLVVPCEIEEDGIERIEIMRSAFDDIKNDKLSLLIDFERRNNKKVIITDGAGLFKGSKSIKHVNIRNTDISGTIAGMFEGTGIKTLDMSYMDLYSVTSYSDMLRNTGDLIDVNMRGTVIRDYDPVINELNRANLYYIIYPLFNTLGMKSAPFATSSLRLTYTENMNFMIIPESYEKKDDYYSYHAKHLKESDYNENEEKLYKDDQMVFKEGYYRYKESGEIINWTNWY